MDTWAPKSPRSARRRATQFSLAIVALQLVPAGLLALSSPRVPGSSPLHPAGAIPTSKSTRVASAPTVGAMAAAPPARDSYSVLRAVGVGGYPDSVAYDAGMGELFVANGNTANLSVISDSSSSVVANISVGQGPEGVAYDPAKGKVYVADTNLSIVSDSSNMLVGTVTLASAPIPFGVAYDSGKGELFVTDFQAKTVYVVNDTTNTVATTISTSYNGTGIAYDSAKGELFIANFWDGKVTVISDSSNSQVTTITVGSNPLGVAYDSGTGKVYVTNSGLYGTPGNTVSVISDSNNTVVATIAVGYGPSAVTSAPGTGHVLVTSALSDNASVIATATDSVSQTVGLYVGGGAFGAAFDPSNGGVYIAEALIDVVAILVNGYTVTFTATGLPGSTPWVVYLNGSTAFGTANISYGSVMTTVTTALPNGQWSFAVQPLPGYQITPSSGTFTIAGSGFSQTIVFAQLFQVTFTESGLPSGTSWSVDLNGTTQSATGATITFHVTNGTYSFTVPTVGSYRPTMASGTVPVAGSTVSQPITFVFTAPTPYVVSFTAAGLPSGTNWSVTLNGTTRHSTTTTINFAEPNGSYAFTVGPIAGYVAGPASGNLSVDGQDVGQTITFVPMTYAVTFTETGLPAGTSWSVTLGGSTKSSQTTSVAFQEPNGTYNYTVGAPSGYSGSPSIGSLGVNGAAAGQSIAFTSTGSGGSTNGLLGLPGNEGLYIIVGVVALAVVAGLAFGLMRRRRAPPAPGSGTPPASEAPPT